MSQLESIIDDIGGDLDLVELMQRPGEPIYGLHVDGARAATIWDALYERLTVEPFWPLIVGTDHDLDAHREAIGLLSSPAAENIEHRARATFSNLESMPLDDAVSQSFDVEKDAADDISVTPVDSETDARPAAAQLPLEVPQNLALGAAHDDVVVMLVPVEHTWECPLALNFGGWNDCPPPEAHAAQMARWAQEWGAELISASDTTIELRVAKHPQSWKKGFDLASQHAEYCPELVSRGSWNLRTLAKYLCEHHLWRFWWS